jgi:hypothetical protein
MSGNEDYNLDWATFDADITDSEDIRASSISTIQANMDLIKNNLDNITHDTSHLGDNRSTHYTDHYDAHDDQQKTTEYTDHDTTEKTDHRITDYADHRTSQKTTHYGSRYASNDSTDYANYNTGVDQGYYLTKYSDYDRGVTSTSCPTHHAVNYVSVYSYEKSQYYINH